MADTSMDYSAVSGFNGDDNNSDLQRRSPPTTATPSPNMNGGGGHTETEDEGPVIRVAATRSKRPPTEPTGNGNALIMDTRNFMQFIVGRKLARKIHCGHLWLIKDYCGLFCAFMTWGLIFYAEFVMWFVLVPSRAISYWNVAIWQCWASLALLSHWRAMLSDPGAIPVGNCTMDNLRRLGYAQPKIPPGAANDPNYQQPPVIVYKCPRCACIKPDKSHHCSICRRCIFKMDHHCPWVNNCVGMLNQKFFILFTLYICLMSAHAIVINLSFLFTCFPYIDPHAAARYERDAAESANSEPPSPMCLRGDSSQYLISLSGGIIFVIFMLFEAVIFSLFTAIMFGTQIHALCTETSTVESMKKVDAEAGMGHNNSEHHFDGEPLMRKRRDSGSKSGKASCFAPLGEAFGDRKPPNIRWLSPFHDHYLRRPGFMEPLLDDGTPASIFLSSVRTA